MTIKQTISGAWNWIKAKVKWILLAVLSIGTVYAAGNIIEQPPKTEIKQELKLKCDKSKILESKEITISERIVLISSSTKETMIIPAETFVQYDYISDVEVLTDKGEDITKRIGNAKFFKKELTDEGQVFEGRFYSGTPFIKLDKWFYSETATTSIEAFKEQTKPDLVSRIKGLFTAQADTTSYYVGAGDGRVGGGPQTTWDAVHNASTGTEGAKGTDTLANIQANKTGSSFYLWRAFTPVDTSALPDDVTITDATLTITLDTSYGSGTTARDYGIVQTTQASNTTLTTEDFDQCGTTHNATEGATRLAIAGDETGTKTFTLNGTGKGWVSKTGYTLLGIRQDKDLDDVEPIDDQAVGFRCSEYAGTDSDPYLSVTYSEAFIPQPDLW